MMPTASPRSNPFPRLGVALGFILLLDGAYLVGGPLVRASLERLGFVCSAFFLALPLADVPEEALGTPVKAVTYHQLRIQERDGRWEIHVVLDL